MRLTTLNAGLALLFFTSLASVPPGFSQTLYTLANDHPDTWLALSSESLSDPNGVVLRVERRSQDENETVLRSYAVVACERTSGRVLPGFRFPRPAARLHFSGEGLLYLPPMHNAAIREQTERSLRRLITPYWHNGAAFVRLNGGRQDSTGVTLPIENTGIYQLRAVLPPSEFRLVRGSPYPRLLTPNAANNRRIFFFFDNPANAAVTGWILDRRGAKVRELHVEAMAESRNVLIWDGTDDHGAVVPGGAYFYKISAGDASVTGSVGLAR